MVTLPATMPGSYLVIPSEDKVWAYSGTTAQSRWKPVTAEAMKGGVLGEIANVVYQQNPIIPIAMGLYLLFKKG